MPTDPHAPTCNCWLGTTATFGNSDVRAACPVHGDSVAAPAAVGREPHPDQLERWGLNPDAREGESLFWRTDDGYWTPWHIAQAEVERLRSSSVPVATPEKASDYVRHRSGCSAWASDPPQEWRDGDEELCDCGAAQWVKPRAALPAAAEGREL